MSDKPSPDETAIWQRRLASQANNRAWTLSESLNRTPGEDDEMLQAAHAAMYFWKIVGNARNHAHAAQLVAHVSALLGQGGPAKHFQAKSQPFFGEGSEPWELAMTQLVAANVAAANNDVTGHREHYEKAVRLIETVPDAENRQILGATLRVVPAPKDDSSAA
jgi:hypothetical protein